MDIIIQKKLKFLLEIEIETEYNCFEKKFKL